MPDYFVPINVADISATDREVMDRWEKHLQRPEAEMELRCYILNKGDSIVACKIAEDDQRILLGLPCSPGVIITDRGVRTEVMPYCRIPIAWLWKNNIAWDHNPFAETEHYYCKFLLSEANRLIPGFVNDYNERILHDRMTMAKALIDENPIETRDALESVGQEYLLDEEQEEEAPSPTIH